MNRQVGGSAIPMVSSVGGSAALPTTRKLCFRACLTSQQLSECGLVIVLLLF